MNKQTKELKEEIKIPNLVLNNKVKIPMLGLGTWQAKDNDVKFAVKTAINLGYRHIDTAKIYGNEEQIGDAIKELEKLKQIKREDLFLTTKLWLTDFVNPTKALETSLKKLQTKYVDLYLLHFPVSGLRNSAYKKLEVSLKEEKIRALGVSNFTIKHLESLMEKTNTVPCVNQVELTPYLNQTELLKFCKKNKIIVEAYSPLTRGKKLNDPKLVEIAKKYNKTTAQILIRWCIQKETVVLPKSTNKERLKENMNVFDFKIKSSDMKILDSFNENARYCWDPTLVP